MTAPDDTVSCEPGSKGEISVSDVLAVLTKHNKMIIALVLIVGLVTLISGIVMNYRRYGTVQPYVYRSESVIVPQGATLDQLQAALDDPRLTAKVIEKNRLLPLFSPRLWDGKGDRWKTARPPDLQEASVALRNMLEITSEGGGATLRIVFTHADPALARQVLGAYIEELRDFIRPPAVYFSECIIAPGNVTMDQIKTEMSSRNLTKQVIEKNGLLPLLYPRLWDEKRGRWIAAPPTMAEAAMLLKGMLEIKKDKEDDTLRLVFIHETPDLAGKLPALYLRELKELLGRSARKGREKVAALKKKLLQSFAAAKYPELKKEIAARIVTYEVEEKELELSEVSGFDVIMPPSPPRKQLVSAFELSGPPVPPAKVNQLRFYLLLPMLLALIVSCFLAFVLEYWDELRAHSSGKVREIKKRLVHAGGGE